VNQSTIAISTAENLIRSAKAPTTRQAVSAANVHWKATNTNSGITTPALNVAAIESAVMPARNRRSKPPIQVPVPEKARL
jgi:hypothetical protein